MLNIIEIIASDWMDRFYFHVYGDEAVEDVYKYISEKISLKPGRKLRLTSGCCILADSHNCKVEKSVLLSSKSMYVKPLGPKPNTIWQLPIWMQ